MCEESHPERQELELPCNFIIKTRAVLMWSLRMRVFWKRSFVFLRFLLEKVSHSRV